MLRTREPATMCAPQRWRWAKHRPRARVGACELIGWVRAAPWLGATYPAAAGTASTMPAECAPLPGVTDHRPRLVLGPAPAPQQAPSTGDALDHALSLAKSERAR